MLNLSIKLKSTQGTFGHFKCCRVAMPTNIDVAEILFCSLINRSKMTKLFYFGKYQKSNCRRSSKERNI